MFDKYSLEISKVFKGAENEMFALHHPYVGTEHLLLSLMKNDEVVSKLLEKNKLTYEAFRNELNLVVGAASKTSTIVLYTPLLKRVINTALEDAKRKKEELKPIHLLLSLIEEGEGIAIRILLGMNINLDKIYEEIKKNDKKCKTKLEIFNIGKNLQEIVNPHDLVIGRDKEINLIIETLIRKNKNNPLLIGDAGVGKSAIVEELARRINKKEVPKSLQDKIIVSLEMSQLVAGTKYRGEFEEKLNKIIKELEENPEIILFIDEMHTMVNAGGAEGAINASDILKPYLARGQIKIIGATTTGEYNKFIIKDKALNRRFEIIKIIEPTPDETIDILTKVKPSFEAHYNIKISDENIKDIVSLANNYILDRFNPDKSLDILDSVCAMKEVETSSESKIKKLEQRLGSITKEKEKMVLENDFNKALELCEKEKKINKEIDSIIKTKEKITKEEILLLLYRKCNIPVIKDKEKEFNLLETKLKEEIIGQEKALDRIIDNLKKHDGKMPLSILLTGSTGVGKTNTVKLISKYLHLPLIRLDMSEYNTDTAVNRLIGASAGYIGYDDTAIFDKVKMTPFSIILVDELEKAHPAVINLFLQILDEGFITNSKGEKIDFKNTYIFMTSNARASQKIGFMKSIPNYHNNFSKEFIARFTDIINYENITLEKMEEYLTKKGIKDLDIIKDFDYQNVGFRGLDKYLKSKKEKVS